MHYCIGNALLKLSYAKYEMKSLFSLIILTGICGIWEAFLILNLLSFLIAFSSETNSKARTSYSLLVFIIQEDAGMISEFGNCFCKLYL